MTWKREVSTAALVIVLGVPADVSTTTRQGKPADQVDTASYAGLLSDKGNVERLTQNPRDVYVSVDFGETPRRFDDPAFSRPLHLRMIESASCRADLVAIARVTEEAPFLSPNETWILTRYQLVISEVVRDRQNHYQQHGTVTYVHPSGKVGVGGRPVSTIVSGFPRLIRGREYLLFLKRIPGTGHLRSVFEVPLFSVDGTALRAFVTRTTDAPSTLQAGLDRSSTLGHIQASDCSGKR